MRMSSCAGSAAVMSIESCARPRGRGRTVYRTGRRRDCGEVDGWTNAAGGCTRPHRWRFRTCLPDPRAYRVGRCWRSRLGRRKMRILVCGGAGYIGSHTCTVLAGRGPDLLVADSFVNSSPRALERLRRLVDSPMRLRQAELRVRAEVEALFEGEGFDAVVHFAALQAVGGPWDRPPDSYEHNITPPTHAKK